MKNIYLIFIYFASISSTYSQISVVSNDVTFFYEPFKTTNGIYFSGSNVDVGVEPYFYDGNATPILLKDIFIGPSQSYANEFIEFQNKIYFSARNSADNFELWTTDGTEVGTILFKDINTNTGEGSYPSDFIVYNNQLLFTARQSPNNPELFTSDGTEVGTTLLKEIQTGQFGSIPDNKTLYNNTVFFRASNGGGGVNTGFELWTSDGTNAGTNLFLDINSGNPNSWPTKLFVHNGLLFFNADNGINGRELWLTNGTISGTQMLADLNSGIADGLSQTGDFYTIQNKMYFAADNGTLGEELWYYDSNTNNINLTNDINLSGDFAPYNFIELNGNLFFSADDGINGRELHKIDGVTNVFTHFDLNPNGSSNPSKGVVINNRLYFAADDGTNGTELWVTDGTINGTQMLADLNPGSASSYPTHLTEFNGELIFSTTAGIYKFNDAILGVNDIKANPNIGLYPNPTTSHFSINSNTSIKSITLYNILGKQVINFTTNQEHYNIEALKRGIYFVKIHNGNSEQTIKLIKD